MYQNRGNTFMLFSADPLVSQKEFEAHLKAQVAEDGTILNTVQNDPRIRLVGKAGDKNVKVRNNLNRERAGQLISLAYFSPYKNTILFRLGALLNTQSGYTNAIRVTYEDKVTQADRGNVTERIVTMENGQYVVNGKTYSDFDSLLNTEFGSFDSNQMLMQTGYISRVGKFEFNDPSFMIYNIFADFVGKTEKLQEHIENNPNFKQGIYVFDDAVKVVPGSQFYYEVDTANKLYSTNASNLIGNDFIKKNIQKIAQALADISKEELMNTVSFVFQNSRLIKGTIYDNVKLGKENATKEQVLSALQKAQCMDIIDKLPNGIDTLIGTNGIYLSGGECQRIAIARAILKDSPIVILDEATAFADPDNETKVQQAFNTLSKGKTVIMIAHRLSTVINADKIFVINNGEIAESGSSEELINSNGFFSSMWKNYQTSVNWKVKKEVVK